MINALPVIGWFLSLIGNASLAVPFWICWTVCGIGEEYFAFLPTTYHSIPFWNCVGLFMVLSVLRSQVPTFVSVSNTNKGKD